MSDMSDTYIAVLQQARKLKPEEQDQLILALQQKLHTPGLNRHDKRVLENLDATTSEEYWGDDPSSLQVDQW